MSSYNNFNKLIKVVGRNAWANWQSLLNNPSKLSGSIVFVDTTNDNTANAVKCKLIYANGIVYNVADASAFNDLYTYVTNTVDGSIDNISTRLSQLLTYVKQVVDTSISNISTRLSTTNTNLNEVSARLNNTSSTINDLSTYIRTTIDSSINDLSSGLNTIKNSIGLKDNYDLDLTLDASTFDLKDDVTVKEAILTLEKMYLDQQAAQAIYNASLNQLMDAYMYIAPNPIDAIITVTPTSIFNGQSVNATWVVTLNNYQSNIATATLDGQDITTTLRTGSASIQSQISDTTTKSVTISSNYIDSHGASPAIYNGSASITVSNKHYVTTNTTKYNNGQFPITTSDLQTYTAVIDTNIYDAVCSDEFIYVLSTKNVASDNTKIHNTGACAVGTGGVQNLGAVSITEFDSPVTYYLYKSEQKLTGNWTIEL